MLTQLLIKVLIVIVVLSFRFASYKRGFADLSTCKETLINTTRWVSPKQVWLVCYPQSQPADGARSQLSGVSLVSWQPSPAPCCSVLFLPSHAMNDPMFTPGKRAGGSSGTLNTLWHPKQTDSSVSDHCEATHLHYHLVWRHQLSGSVGCQDKASWFQIISTQIPRWHKITSDLGGLGSWR